ncbi:hypothetical protein CRG98_035202 [Punica granatum]|uniref:Nuclease associated modular domain-containing protein n=1 Tax=Punica granatum TaxID=22663 RepID=A0A2I0IK83_PUNGR|nr:hypothetical protein CRG98_035202 [Punica granatum]
MTSICLFYCWTEIAKAQPNFQSQLGILRAQASAHSNLFSSTLTFGSDRRLTSTWKSLNNHRRISSDIGRNRFVIKAVATLEAKRLALSENGHVYRQNSLGGTDSSPCATPVESSGEDSEELDEREKLRRRRISKANKGNTPWNKGRKHSAETLQRIRERTRLAMQNPKVKMKLVNMGHAQTKETRQKIGAGVRMGWQKRREKLMVQENCHYEWQNLIAEASRRGYTDERELQWDSYDILNEQLEQEWLESVEERKGMRNQKGNKRAPKSLEQRRKIAEAIAAKWADPAYRERVCSGLSKYHGVPVGTERKPRRKPSGSTDSTRRIPSKRKAADEIHAKRCDPQSQIQRMKLKRSKTPVYKDPLASSKLEMIKNIRAKRTAADTNRTEAIERARLLIADAEKAAKALEVAAVRSPIARASLEETKKLVAEAIQLIESIEAGATLSVKTAANSSIETASISSNQSRSLPEYHPYTLSEPTDHIPEERKVNGSAVQLETPEKGRDKFSFGHPPSLNQLGLEDNTDHSTNEADQTTGPNGHNNCKDDPCPSGSESNVQSSDEDLPPKSTVTVTKKWVHGRLVAVTTE